MSRVVSHLLAFLYRCITLLPLRVLYVISDLTYYPMYYIAGYRKKVVFRNLRNAFPSMTEREIHFTAKRFYHHFCDVFYETGWLMYASPASILRRISYSDRHLIDDPLKEGRAVIAAVGHYGNWEWLNSFALTVPYPTIAIYKEQNDPVFDRLFFSIRSRFGSRPVPMKQTLRVIREYRDRNTPFVACFIADQSPVRQELEYWTTFLNQDTPVFLGIEKIARKYDFAVVYLEIMKVRRGNYRVEIHPVAGHAADTPPYEITEKHVKRLEQTILSRPEYWIWSHRRWKFTRKDMVRRKNNPSGTTGITNNLSPPFEK